MFEDSKPVGTATSLEALEHLPSGGWEHCPSCTSTAPLHGHQLCDSAVMFLCVCPEPHLWAGIPRAALGMGNMHQVLKTDCHVWEESGIVFFKKSVFHMAVLTKVSAYPVL